MKSDLGNILVPFDFSTTAKKAISTGFILAYKLGKKITFLHVLKENQTEFDSDKIKKTIDELNPNPNKVSYKIVVKKGIPEDKITQYAHEISAFLIVMCTRTKEQKIKDLIGSVTSEVMSMSNVPVLAIPENFNCNDITLIKNIAYASSLKSHQEIEHIQLLEKVFPLDNKSIEIISSIKGKFDMKDSTDIVNKLSEMYPTIAFSAKTLIYDNKSSASDSITQYLVNSDIELIVIKKYHRRIFLPSISNRFAVDILANTESKEIPIIQLPVEMDDNKKNKKNLFNIFGLLK